ncbi:MAG: enoyl-CoA hydratase-related protein [Syntrophales bacterium]|jgi:enoyl-CoA hydratase/carnithine racemase|nr:enoyl-CoA hydratase-related protein [Syntrophales bacterium]MDY0044763.1 enoyl-CoA hydratase-related protein [Syntrophales bacterium]
MAYSTIFVTIDDGIATVTLNRPDVMNAWNASMAAEISEAFTVLNNDDTIRAIVLTGAGSAFCAGSDLSGNNAFKAGTQDMKEKRKALAFPSIMPWELRKPVLAAINGHAIGVGITFPMSCDMRFVAEDAKIQFAFVRRGIIPELSSHALVARIAGFSVASDLMLTGRIILGRDFARLGLASEALPATDVLPATIARAREFHKAAPVSVAISKKLLWEGLDMPVSEIYEREFSLFSWICEQPDATEGVMSFLEKRDPLWSMKTSRDLPDLL